MSAGEFISQKTKPVISAILLLFAGIIAGSRIETLGGYDTSVYKIMYDSTTPSFSSVFQQDFLLNTTEKGYILLMAVFKMAGFSFNWFLLTLGFSCALIIWRIFNSMGSHLVLAFTIFLGKGYLYYFFTAQRQIIAMCICWYALRFVKDRKLIPFILCCIGAAFFHTSAIVFVLIYFFAKIKIDNRWSIILLCLSIIAGVSGLGALIGGFLTPYLPTAASEKLTGYITGPTQTVNIFNFFEMVPIFVFTLMKRKEMSKKLKNFDLFYNLFLVFILITFAFYDFTFIMRLKGYFLIGYIMIFATIPYAFHSRQVGLGPLILIICYCLIVMVRELITFDLGEGYLPYQSFLMQYL